MRTALKAVAITATLLFVLLAGIRIGSNRELLPGPLAELAGPSRSASFDEAIGLIEDNYYRKIDDSTLQNAGIDGAVSKLRDRFSAYLDPRAYRAFQSHQNPHFSGIGLDVRFIRDGLLVARVYPNTPAQKAGIKAGETVISVNGKPIRGKSGGAAVALIQGKPGTPVTVGIRNPSGKVRDLKVKRERIFVPSVESKTIVGPGGVKVGVVSLSGFVQRAGAQVSKAVKAQLAAGAKAIVLDLRGNGGGLLDEAVAVGSVFIESGPIVITKGRNRPREVYRASGGAIPAKVPVVVLVDRNTASASEIVAGAVQDSGRGIVVGTRTFGKGVFQEVTELGNGGALDITVGEYFTPSGRNLGGGGVKQGAGVRPDVPVARSAGLAGALDAAVAAAARRAR
jgi:carboxyl-terminal processing protease